MTVSRGLRPEEDRTDPDKEQGKGILVGGNSTYKGPEEGLLDNLKENDRKPVWLEDSRCGGEW